MRTLRIALIWMLMLALPAQSMAAISMQLCGLGQQGEMGGMDKKTNTAN